MTSAHEDLSSITRRRLILGAGGLAACTLLPGRTFAQTDSPTELNKLFDQVYSSMLAFSPELASVRGLDAGGARSRLDDRSSAAQRRSTIAIQSSLSKIDAIDRSQLTDAQARQCEIVSHHLNSLVRNRQRYFYGDDRFFAYRLSQFTGAYVAVPQVLASAHPVKDGADRDAYISRLENFSDALDQDTDRQREDAARGVVAPGFILDMVLRNLEAMAKPENAYRQLLDPLVKKSATSGVKVNESHARSVVSQRVVPALQRQIAATSLLRATASDVPGVWRLPEGDAFYEDALGFSSTSDLTPDQAYAVGLDKVAEAESKLDALFRKRGYTSGSSAQRLDALKKDLTQYYPDSDAGRQALLDYFARDLAKVAQALPSAFFNRPAHEVVVQRMPSALEGMGPSAAYMPAGSDQAKVIVDLKDMSKWPRFSLSTLCRHEGIPGHHMQASMLDQSTGSLALLSLFPNPAYSEGWALYAEQLTQELGLYDDDPMGEIGMWQSFLYRASRIVVDTGIHRKRWSRERAVQYMSDTTAMPMGMIQSEIGRYTIIPGQACAYMLGQIQWLKVREAARLEAGQAFDLRRFHDVLKDGPMPMAILERLVRSRRHEWSTPLPLTPTP